MIEDMTLEGDEIDGEVFGAPDSDRGEDAPDLAQRAKRIAEAVMLAAETERPSMIDAACGDDHALRSAVLRHLAGTEASETETIANTVVSSSAGSERLPEMIGSYRIRRVIQSGHPIQDGRQSAARASAARYPRVIRRSRLTKGSN